MGREAALRSRRARGNPGRFRANPPETKRLGSAVHSAECARHAVRRAAPLWAITCNELCLRLPAPVSGRVPPSGMPAPISTRHPSQPKSSTRRDVENPTEDPTDPQATRQCLSGMYAAGGPPKAPPVAPPETAWSWATCSAPPPKYFVDSPYCRGTYDGNMQLTARRQRPHIRRSLPSIVRVPSCDNRRAPREQFAPLTLNKSSSWELVIFPATSTSHRVPLPPDFTPHATDTGDRAPPTTDPSPAYAGVRHRSWAPGEVHVEALPHERHTPAARLPCASDGATH